MTDLRLIDTDTITFYQHGREPLVKSITAAASQPSGLGVTIITIEEQVTGRQAALRHAKTDAQLAYAYQVFTASVRTLTGLHVVTFTEPTIALEEGATVVTRNLRGFGRVPELHCENWAD